jgi:hypothetical protein
MIASHCNQPQVPQHTTHQATTAAGHGTQPNCPHSPRHAVSPNTAVTSMPLGAARPHQCPLHQPGPCRASIDSSPCPCTSQAHFMQVPTAPHAHACVMQPQCDSQPTAQDNNTAPPHCPHPLLYRPLPTLPTHCQKFAGNIGMQVGHRSLGGGATYTRAAANAAALCPSPPQGLELFTLYLISDCNIIVFFLQP